MSTKFLIRVGIFAALSMPLVAASAGEIDQAGLSQSVDKPAVIDVSIAFESPTAGKALGAFKKKKGLFDK